MDYAIYPGAVAVPKADLCVLTNTGATCSTTEHHHDPVISWVGCYFWGSFCVWNEKVKGGIRYILNYSNWVDLGSLLVGLIIRERRYGNRKALSWPCNVPFRFKSHLSHWTLPRGLWSNNGHEFQQVYPDTGSGTFSMPACTRTAVTGSLFYVGLSQPVFKWQFKHWSWDTVMVTIRIDTWA